MEETPRWGGKHSFAQVWRYNPEWYGMMGTRCRTCGTVIRRIVQQQRGTFYCPRCQR